MENNHISVQAETNTVNSIPIANDTGNSTTTSNNPSQTDIPPQKKNPLDMTLEEQAKHYKDLFLRSKKLILHYEENMKTKENTIKSLKDKLKEYEAGNNRKLLIFKSNLII
jgi:hypothetical protein